MSKMKHWREDPEEELACMIERGELSTFWNSNVDLVVGPGETLIWIKDGKIEDVVTQSRLNNIGGGFRNWLATKVISGQDVKMLIVDNKPFKIQIGAEGNTSDNVIQEGTATLTLRLNHEQANRIAGVLKEKAIKVTRGFFRKREVIEGYETKLLRSDIEQMFAEEANAKVFGPTIRRFSAAEFGNSNVSSRIESAAQIELKNTLELWGMSLENVYVAWGSNEYQEWMATRAPTQWGKIARREDAIQDEKWKDEDSDRDRERKRRRKRADFEDDLDDVTGNYDSNASASITYNASGKFNKSVEFNGSSSYFTVSSLNSKGDHSSSRIVLSDHSSSSSASASESSAGAYPPSAAFSPPSSP